MSDHERQPASLEHSSEPTQHNNDNSNGLARIATAEAAARQDAEERKLAPIPCLVIIILMNLFMNCSFFIIVPSAPAYATYLGAPTWFSGFAIGASTAAAGILLYPVSRKYQLAYKTPFLASCACFVLGHIIYSCAGLAGTAWLMAAGRIVGGLGYISWMLVKRYITDPRINGTRRRTMLSAWLVTSQVLGTAIGPFAGGLLTKIGSIRTAGKLWNGFNAPSWIMAGVWAIFLVGVSLVFEDPPDSEPPTTLLEDVKALANRARRHQVERIELTRDVKRDALQTRDGAFQQDSPAPAPIISIEEQESRTHAPQTRLSASNWASLGLMCWTAMLTFFTIGAWEVNIPVFSADFPGLNWTEAKAGNVLALGAVIVLPLLFGLVFLAKHIQDRQILLTGMSIGLGGLIIHMVTLTPGLERSINFGSFFTSWVLVALGYNMMSTVTLSLLSKQVPPEFNNYTSLIIQLSNYSGRLGGAFWGTAVDQVGQRAIMSVELVLTLVGMLGTFVLWSRMYAPKG